MGYLLKITVSRLFLVLLSLVVMNENIYAQNEALPLKLSHSIPEIDGVIDDREWNDAQTLIMSGPGGRTITALITYSDQYLFIAFKGLEDENKTRLHPEVLIHTDPEDLAWNASCFWFHSSYSNCLGIGTYYYWDDCTTDPEGWTANTFPFEGGNDNIEFQFSFSLLRFDPLKGRELRLALKLSDAQEQHIYWPAGASLSDPKTWATIRL
jgi:hypothetical protein